MAWSVAKAGDWNTMYGIYSATAVDAEANVTCIAWKMDSSKNLIVDDASIVHLPKNCDQLIMNGDGVYDNDQTAAFWDNLGSGAVLDVTENNGNHAISLSHTQFWDGMEWNRDWMHNV
jgi:hypothetical protein